MAREKQRNGMGHLYKRARDGREVPADSHVPGTFWISYTDERITALLESKQEIFDAFADKSEAANESRELDEKDFGNIIKEEIDRINAKRGNPNGKKAE